MQKRHNSLLFVPLKGVRVHCFRISPVVVILLVIFVTIAVIGFFIPVDSIRLNDEEKNQKRHLVEQNSKIMKKMINLRSMLFTLRSRIDTLGVLKHQVDAVIKKSYQDSFSVAKTENKIPLFRNLDEACAYANKTEQFYARFLERILEKDSYIHCVPLAVPIWGEYVLGSKYGKISDPFTGSLKWHKGLDFTAERGTPIVATATGRVVLVQKHQNWGHRIKIKHRYGFSTVYAHLGIVNVSQGQRVKKGNQIATVGSSGLSTGPHLHYEIHRNGEAVDPMEYFFPEELTALVE